MYKFFRDQRRLLQSPGPGRRPEPVVTVPGTFALMQE
jgi:hypothetical protein